MGIIDQILEDDESRLKKRRHTARRIYDWLKQEYAFTGGYTIVKEYVPHARLRHKEVFVPLAHPPGGAQADLGRGSGGDRRRGANGALSVRGPAALKLRRASRGSTQKNLFFVALEFPETFILPVM